MTACDLCELAPETVARMGSAQKPAKTGPFTPKPRASPTGALVKWRPHARWRGGMNGSGSALLRRTLPESRKGCTSWYHIAMAVFPLDWRVNVQNPRNPGPYRRRVAVRAGVSGLRQRGQRARTYSASKPPSTATASWAPGQGGAVASISFSAASRDARNWKLVPTGIRRESPACTLSILAGSPSRCRHTSPSPSSTYQSSSTVRWRTAFVVAPAGRTQCARPPLSPATRSRISDPSGAR